MAMSNPHIVYRPIQDVTPGAEVSALANVFRFVLFEGNASKKATRPAPEPSDRDGTTVQGDSADAPIVQN
jgi:hypothetical protein